ncbi:IclR family transcriptional regulator [Agrobacterium tumefaciens]|uniref:IclR family transcriptional regulator domain-containing protein n=1 Tax=Agrobacterium tumefaciens TaxID=358 RepID=UPI001572F59F|nr:IclR family transcriptional regulator [Agrobacterium tumefaciens]
MATNVNFSLIKGLAILDLITEGRPEITTAIVVNELGMNTATAHRFLMTLEEAGALTRLQRGTYVLGHQISELGLLAMKANPLLATVQPILDSLCLKINESVSAARLLRPGITCIATTISRQDVIISTRVGRIFETHATAHGKVWLAFMEKATSERYLKATLSNVEPGPKSREIDSFQAEFSAIREAGYAVNKGEREPEIGGVAVPVFSASGKVFLTLAMYCFVSRLTEKVISDSVGELKAAATTISEAVNFKEQSSPSLS